jgi:hypothetical protein
MRFGYQLVNVPIIYLIANISSNLASRPKKFDEKKYEFF